MTEPCGIEDLASTTRRLRRKIWYRTEYSRDGERGIWATASKVRLVENRVVSGRAFQDRANSTKGVKRNMTRIYPVGKWEWRWCLIINERFIGLGLESCFGWWTELVRFGGP